MNKQNLVPPYSEILFSNTSGQIIETESNMDESQIMLSHKAGFKRLYIICAHLYDILEKTNLSDQKTVVAKE